MLVCRSNRERMLMSGLRSWRRVTSLAQILTLEDGSAIVIASQWSVVWERFHVLV